jgi:hypothetical protein
MRCFPVAVVAVLALILGGVGCSHKIGDSCSTNVDCQPDGTRFCDTSAPSGYCTILGCDTNTCPGEAVCIRFLTPILDEPCTYHDDQPNTQSDCPHIDDRCVCDTTIKVDGKQVCENGIGHCAPESSEHRWCQYKCSSNGDCRSGYECRSTGTFGAEPVPTLSNPTGNSAKFCAPKAPPEPDDLGEKQSTPDDLASTDA